MGWRYLMFTLGAITLATCGARVAFFRFYESPKFLFSQGRAAEAVDVVRKVAKINRREQQLDEASLAEVLQGHSDNPVCCSTPEDSISSSGEKTKRRKLKLLVVGGFPGTRMLKQLLGRPSMARLTLLTWVVYAADFWGFTLAGTFLPLILQRKGADLDVSVHTTYRNYIIIYLCGIPGVISGMLASSFIAPGKLRTMVWTMVFSSALMAASFFVFTAAAASEGAYVGLTAMEYFFQSMFNAVLYAWTSAAFPTRVRGSACGIASFWGRLCSIVAPLIGSRLLQNGSDGVLYLAGAGGLVCTIALLLLPRTASKDC